jgi:hypothetical protein
VANGVRNPRFADQYTSKMNGMFILKYTLLVIPASHKTNEKTMAFFWF